MGAIVETEPDPLDILEYDPYTSSNTKVDLHWTLLDSSKNGGSAVIGYEIKYLKEGESWASIDVGDSVITYSISSLIGGSTN